MNAALAKKVRKLTVQNKRKVAVEAMREIMSAPLRTRISFAWLVVRGRRGPRVEA